MLLERTITLIMQLRKAKGVWHHFPRRMAYSFFFSLFLPFPFDIFWPAHHPLLINLLQRTLYMHMKLIISPFTYKRVIVDGVKCALVYHEKVSDLTI